MDTTPKPTHDARAVENSAITLSSIPDLDDWSRELEAFVSEISQELTAIAEEFGGVPSWQPVDLKKNMGQPPASGIEPRESKATMAAEIESAPSSSRLQNLKKRLANLNQDRASQPSTTNPKYRS